MLGIWFWGFPKELVCTGVLLIGVWLVCNEIVGVVVTWRLPFSLETVKLSADCSKFEVVIMLFSWKSA